MIIGKRSTGFPTNFLRIFPVFRRIAFLMRPCGTVRFRSKYSVFQLREFGRTSFRISSDGIIPGKEFVPLGERNSVPSPKRCLVTGMFERPKVKSANETGKSSIYRSEDHLFSECFSCGCRFSHSQCSERYGENRNACCIECFIRTVGIGRKPALDLLVLSECPGDFEELMCVVHP